MKKLIASPAKLVRCAIYTRKSTEEGLDQEFNTLDAQRESAEAYITSQQHEGWTCLPDRYDDGGFSGGNMERPALRRLMADIDAGKIDAVIVYKVDRLSRSLLDFARMMGSFEKHQVSFVSVTQHFNTATSLGRLVLNILLSFAQFEREIISERTRDKMAAARRKGKWSGGHPILGYDVDSRSKLVINEAEARRVRAIFELYLEHEALLPVAQELHRRRWVNKRWTTRKGHERGGNPFNKATLHNLLTNVAYIGKVTYKKEVHAGEHAAIVDIPVFEQVHAVLRRNDLTAGARVRNRFGALLKGLLRCASCGLAMTPTHTKKNGNKRYRYYVCSGAQKNGWDTCASKSVPAGVIEQFLIDEIRAIGGDPGLIAEVIAQSNKHRAGDVTGLQAERRDVEKDLARWNAEVRVVIETLGTKGDAAGRLAEIQERIRQGEQRATEIREQLVALQAVAIDPREVALAMSTFDPVWGALTSAEQARVIELLVEQVVYDRTASKVAITFHPAGIKTLAAEVANREEIA